MELLGKIFLTCLVTFLACVITGTVWHELDWDDSIPVIYITVGLLIISAIGMFVTGIWASMIKIWS